jgi:hypothetical protein
MTRPMNRYVQAALISLAIVFTGCSFAMVCTVVYWKFIQGDPSIVAKRPPVPNAGMDVRGIRLASLDAKPMILTPETWEAKPKTEWKAGETMWVSRFDCFFNKVTGPVQRSFIGDDGSIYSLPLIYPPKTTPSGECSAANFATVLPSDMKPQGYTYDVRVIFYKNPMEREVVTAFAPVRLQIVE